MNILILSQYYWPERFAITEIAEGLVSKGHRVTVLTGLPNYPEGDIYSGYEKGKNRHEIHNGVEIYRANLVPRKHDVLHRVLNYYSFDYSARKLIQKIPGDFDVVLVNELSPIMGARPALVLNKKKGIPTLMYEMDLWPESLLAGGIKKNGLVYNHYKRLSGKVYGGMDEILVSTKEHISYIHALPHCADIPISWLPQFASDDFLSTPEEKRNDGRFVLLFAGNVGTAQNLGLVLDAAKLLQQDHPEILFRIAGSGSELPRLKKRAEEEAITNVGFLGSLPKEEMPRLYSESDVLIVSLEDSPYARMTVPAKTQSYMAAGKPILSLAPGATNALVKEAGCGLAVDHLEAEEASRAILSLEKSFGLEAMGLSGRSFYEAHFSKAKFMDALEEKLMEVSKISQSR